MLHELAGFMWSNIYINFGRHIVIIDMTQTYYTHGSRVLCIVEAS